ncbi:MAG TPA: hypothetical protein PLK28_05600 [Candidatus Rifleibacterium sp.]|nr:hypothetical protein [Candidatus Rifleibacterium sp.]
MEPLNKDQFEKYLEAHRPTEEPSVEVFNRLQKEAVWNRPAGPGRFALPLLLILALLAIVVGNISDSNVPEKVKGSEKPVPVIEKVVPVPPPVIASAEFPEKIGVARLLRHYDDDFNLSFAEDKTGVLMLGSSRELDNI